MRKNIGLVVLVLFVLIIVSMINSARAQGDHPCQGGHNCNDDGGGTVILTGGDTAISTGGNKSLLIAPPGLGDVAIARCLGSEAWTLLIGGKQKLVLNQVCMAEFYLKVGRYDLAAQALCNQPGIIEEYSSETTCEFAHDFTPPPTTEPTESNRSFEEHFNLAHQQEEEIEYLQEENASIVGRLDHLTALLEQAPAPVYVPQEPEPKYTDDQYDLVLSILRGAKDEDDE